MKKGSEMPIDFDSLEPCTREDLKKQKLKQREERIAKAKAAGRYMEAQYDYQKQRCYAAEDSWKCGLPIEYLKNISLEESVRFCESILQSDWLVRNLGPQEPIKFKPGRGGASAWGSAFDREILLPEVMREKWIIVHEMAHVLAPLGEWHGKEWVKMYLFLVANVFGEAEMNALADCMRNQGVRW